MSSKKLYKVTFFSDGKTLELYARHVASSALWGFTEVGDIVFDQVGDAVLIDPTEERLRETFKHTKVLHLPMQSIVRVEEVEKRTALTIRDASGEKIMPFPYHGRPLNAPQPDQK